MDVLARRVERKGILHEAPEGQFVSSRLLIGSGTGIGSHSYDSRRRGAAVSEGVPTKPAPAPRIVVGDLTHEIPRSI
mgnify:CR=1